MKEKKRLFQLKGGLMQPVTLEEAIEEPIKEKKAPPIVPKTPRKTITLQKTEYDEWEKMKEEHTWTTLLKTVREGYQFFKKVVANITVRVESGGYNNEPVGSNRRSLPRIPSSLPTQNSPAKAELLQELKKLSEGKMSIKDFRDSCLKPMTEEELGKFQMTEEEIIKLLEKKEIHLEDLKPPK